MGSSAKKKRDKKKDFQVSLTCVDVTVNSFADILCRNPSSRWARRKPKPTILLTPASKQNVSSYVLSKESNDAFLEAFVVLLCCQSRVLLRYWGQVASDHSLAHNDPLANVSRHSEHPESVKRLQIIYSFMLCHSLSWNERLSWTSLPPLPRAFPELQDVQGDLWCLRYSKEHTVVLI